MNWRIGLREILTWTVLCFVPRPGDDDGEHAKVKILDRLDKSLKPIENYLGSTIPCFGQKWEISALAHVSSIQERMRRIDRETAEKDGNGSDRSSCYLGDNGTSKLD